MNRTLVFFTLFLCTSLATLSQNRSIEGKISESGTGFGLPGVSVYLEGTKKGTATNAQGIFTIRDITPGSYTLVISSIGYETLKESIEVGNGENISQVFELKESVRSLPGVTVISGGYRASKEIPGSVTYISPKQIQKYNFTDVNRVLGSVPGINMQEEDGFGLRPNIGLRGTGVERSSKITLMEDGILMAPAPYSAPAAYYFPTIGRMQAIEVLKGSSQIKYGPYTTGGALNLLSTQIPDEFGGRVSLIGGSFGTRNLHAFVGNSGKNFAYMVESFQMGSEGFKNLPGNGETGFAKADYLVKLRVNTGPDAKFYQALELKLGQSRETSNETYLGLTEDDFELDPFQRYAASQNDLMSTEQSQVSLRHTIRFDPNLEVSTTAYRNDFHRNWYKLDKVTDANGISHSIGSILDDPVSFGSAYMYLTGNTNTDDDTYHVKANNRTYYAQGVQSEVRWKFGSGEFEHDLTGGIRYHTDGLDRFQWVDSYRMISGSMQETTTGIPGTESNRLESATALATYLQHQFTWKNLTLVPGIRYENIRMEREDYGKQDPDRIGTDVSTRSNNVAIWIPGFGANYLFNNNLRVFTGIHKGFAPPGSREGTEPEISVNYEWGARWDNGFLSTELILFHNNYRNLLGADLNAAGGGGSGDLYNAGRVRTTGLEFQMNYDLLGMRSESFRLPVNLAYTWTDARFMNDFDSDFDGWGSVNKGDKFPYLASHQMSMNISLEHLLFNFNIRVRYMDAMRTRPGQGEIPTSEGTDAFVVVDTSGSYKLTQSISAFGSITNLGDRVYIAARRPAGLRPGMPRAFNLGLRANF